MYKNMFKYAIFTAVLSTLVLASNGWSGWMLTPEDGTAGPSTSSPATASNKPAQGGGFSALQEDEGASVSNPAAAAKGYEVSLINARKSADNTVLVSWENPDVKSMILTVYRGTNQLNTSGRLSAAKIVKQYAAASNSFSDGISASGTYYYAVTVTADGSENRDLTPDQSMTTIGVPVTYVQPQARNVTVMTTTVPAAASAFPGQVTGLTAVLQDTNKVHLAWAPVRGSNIAYNVYRSKTAIVVSSDLREITRTLLDNSCLDVLPQAGSYYYAVTVKNAAGENRRVCFGTNALASAVVYQAPVAVAVVPAPAVVTQKPAVVKPVQPVAVLPAAVQPAAPQPLVVPPRPVQPAAVQAMPIQPKPVQVVPVQAAVTQRPAVLKDYDYIMLTVKQKFFYAEDYASAIERLSDLTEDPDCPEEVRDEAWLFLGKSYYYIRDYSRALKIMVKIRRAFPDEADFWISRIAAKL